MWCLLTNLKYYNLDFQPRRLVRRYANLRNLIPQRLGPAILDSCLRDTGLPKCHGNLALARQPLQVRQVKGRTVGLLSTAEPRRADLLINASSSYTRR